MTFKFCKNCYKEVKVEPRFNLALYLLLLCTIIGPIFYAIYYFTKEKTCPFCGKGGDTLYRIKPLFRKKHYLLSNWLGLLFLDLAFWIMIFLIYGTTDILLISEYIYEYLILLSLLDLFLLVTAIPVLIVDLFAAQKVKKKYKIRHKETIDEREKLFTQASRPQAQLSAHSSLEKEEETQEKEETKEKEFGFIKTHLENPLAKPYVYVFIISFIVIYLSSVLIDDTILQVPLLTQGILLLLILSIPGFFLLSIINVVFFKDIMNDIDNKHFTNLRKFIYYTFITIGAGITVFLSFLLGIIYIWIAFWIFTFFIVLAEMNTAFERQISLIPEKKKWNLFLLFMAGIPLTCYIGIKIMLALFQGKDLFGAIIAPGIAFIIGIAGIASIWLLSFFLILITKKEEQTKARCIAIFTLSFGILLASWVIPAVENLAPSTSALMQSIGIIIAFFSMRSQLKDTNPEFNEVKGGLLSRFFKEKPRNAILFMLYSSLFFGYMVSVITLSFITNLINEVASLFSIEFQSPSLGEAIVNTVQLTIAIGIVIPYLIIKYITFDLEEYRRIQAQKRESGWKAKIKRFFEKLINLFKKLTKEKKTEITEQSIETELSLEGDNYSEIDFSIQENEILENKSSKSKSDEKKKEQKSKEEKRKKKRKSKNNKENEQKKSKKKKKRRHESQVEIKESPIKNLASSEKSGKDSNIQDLPRIEEQTPLDYAKAISYIQNLPKVYSEITFSKLSSKTGIDSSTLEDIVEDMIITKDLSAKIKKDSILFQSPIEKVKNSASIGQVEGKKWKNLEDRKKSKISSSQEEVGVQTEKISKSRKKSIKKTKKEKSSKTKSEKYRTEYEQEKEPQIIFDDSVEQEIRIESKLSPLNLTFSNPLYADSNNEGENVDLNRSKVLDEISVDGNEDFSKLLKNTAKKEQEPTSISTSSLVESEENVDSMKEAIKKAASNQKNQKIIDDVLLTKKELQKPIMEENKDFQEPIIIEEAPQVKENKELSRKETEHIKKTSLIETPASSKSSDTMDESNNKEYEMNREMSIHSASAKNRSNQEFVKCIICDARNSTSREKCQICGASLIYRRTNRVYCTKCGHKNTSEDIICDNCGYSL